MKRLFTATFFLFLVDPLVAVRTGRSQLNTAHRPSSTPDAASTAARLAYAAQPLSFEINEGQTDARVDFLARGRGFTLFLTPTEAVLSLQRAQAKRSSSGQPWEMHDRGMPDRAAVSMTLVHGRTDVPAEGVDMLPGKVNYMFGADQRRWRLGIPTYGRVQYRDVYPGIDLVYYGSDGELEYDFIVRAGADPSVIRLRLDGAHLSLDGSGDLVGQASGGEIRMRKPVLYQEVEGRRVDVSGSWRLAGSDASFRVHEYDTSRPLVIDPVLVYSTYLGGALNDDNAVSIAVDVRGHAYVTGSTTSSDFPTTADAMQPTAPGGFGDAFLTKLNAAGTGLVYSTYFGGSGSDAASDIALDPRGNIYIVGATQSADFPSANALQAFAGETDAFVTKFDRSGTALVYSTFLGGTGLDNATALAVDPTGIVYLAGFTASTDFPATAGAFQPTNAGGFDGFVASLNRAGSAWRYATYLGGGTTSGEGVSDIDIDPRGRAHVVGTTRATDFPTTPGALQTTFDGLSDQVFVTKLNRSGTALHYSTYFGGAGNDVAFAVAVDDRGFAYIAGSTSTDGLPTTDAAFQPTRGGGDDGLVLSLNRSGSAIRYLTYLGGAGQDWIADIALDPVGQIYLTGTTESANFPVHDAPQPTYGGFADAFATRLTRNGSAAVYSTYIGGNRREDGLAIAMDIDRHTYVTGFTSSRNLPTTPGAFDRSYNGFRDSFVAKLGPSRSASANSPGQ
jgi:hypothetical protein